MVGFRTFGSAAAAGLLATAWGASPCQGRSFGEDVAFMRTHTEVVVLVSADGQSRVAVAPAYQGRVMTSTARGDEGDGHGFIKDDAVASPEFVPHINVFGGEDRFWMGPEGGQFSIFFKRGDPFDLDHWQTPPVIDTEPYRVVFQSPTEVVFQHDATFKNFSGTPFSVRIDRTVRLLGGRDAAKHLGGASLDDLEFVAYESENKLTNIGDAAWTRESGLLSIWILSMLKPSPTTTVVVPFQAGAEEDRGPAVNDAYFGKVPGDRLVVRDDVLFFKADGEYRSKIGLSPARAKPVLGSYDPGRGLLTLAQYTLPQGADAYVNSMWEMQAFPFRGDVVNSYNDGPPSPGARSLGPFYELETSSPAAALKPGASITHVHRTIHLLGSPESLDPIARTTLGVGVKTISEAF